MIKVNKIITSEFNTIIHACIAYMNKLKPIIFFELENTFLNDQQMSTQLDVYIILSMFQYHTSHTFEIINNSPYNERAFLLKSQN